MNQKQSTDNKGQLQKFKEAAREVETDDSEEAFDRARKRAAGAPAEVGKVSEGRPEMTRTANIRIAEMGMKRASTGAACLLAAMVAGCTTLPADYAATLSTQDPKWRSLECEQVRVAALNYKERTTPWAAGLLLGPYGLGLVAASKEQQEKQRKLFAREMHMRCSSLPLPRNLQINPSATSNF